ncbi:F-box only protein 27-like [Eubalaena glacialis]|uniref:F-box only protein 27-like n=1 Tax=Eubalaena glacialis TaxID=27606 RepID=UPI002A5A32D0|nr:F-box only protein 27-like [Eubalaena glacialis]
MAHPGGALAEMQVAAEPGEKTSSRGQPVGIPLLEREPEEALGLNRLPAELLEMVLSHVPPHVLLGRCRRVCRRWRALVDCQALWLSILPRKHAALWPIVSTYLPAADDPRPCVLGRFCERRPIGRNLLRSPRGLDGFQKQPMLSGGDGWTKEGKCKGMPAAPCDVHFLPTTYLVTGGFKRRKCWTWRRRVSGQNSWIVERLRFVSLPGECDDKNCPLAER